MIEATPTTQTRTQAPPRVEQRRSDWRTGLLGLHSILSFIFLYAPIVVLVVFSFTNDSFGVVWKGFTLKWYAQLFQNARLIDATINTLKVAFVSTLISTVIGTLMALAGRAGIEARMSSATPRSKRLRAGRRKRTASRIDNLPCIGRQHVRSRAAGER